MKEFDYICKIYNINDRKLREIKDSCERINSIMPQLQVGDKLYSSNCWGDVFEEEVIEIIDRENGEIKIKEMNRVCNTNIDDLMTLEEAKKLYNIY